MATQATEQVTRTVTAKVHNTGTVSSMGTRFYFTVPAMSQYPGSISLSVPEADAALMHKDGEYVVTLQRGNLKEGKAGEHEWDFWWEWISFGNPTDAEPAPTPQAPATAPQSAVQPVQAPNEREDRSDRRTALMQAVKVLGLTANPETLEFAADATEWLADRFIAWLRNDTPAPPLVQEAINAGGVLLPDDLPFDLDGGPPDA
jgi:hypothetical protein